MASLNCRNKRFAVARLEEEDPAPRADAPDADDLVGEIDDRIGVEDVLAVAGEAGTTVVEERHDALELVSEVLGFGTDDERRVGGDDPAAVDDLGELRRGSDAVLAVRLRHRLANQLLETLALGTTRDLRQVVDLDTRVPDVERIGHRREREGCAIDLDRRRRDRTGLLRVQAVVPSRDHQACREPLHVPLEGAGQRLVEVVHVDDEPTVGCGEGTEVGDVRVAAELDLEVGTRGSRRGPRP